MLRDAWHPFGNKKINNDKCIVVIICVDKRERYEPAKAQSGRHHTLRCNQCPFITTYKHINAKNVR